jgi:hypothetical protein
MPKRKGLTGTDETYAHPNGRLAGRLESPRAIVWFVRFAHASGSLTERGALDEERG